MNSQESNSPQRNGSETVPNCNTSPQFPSFFGTTYPHQVHAADMFLVSNYPQEQKDAYAKGQVLFSSALDKWLPCHGNASSTGGDHGRSSERSSSSKCACVADSRKLNRFSKQDRYSLLPSCWGYSFHSSRVDCTRTHPI